MRMSKPRNRENRTKTPKPSNMCIVKLKLPRNSYDQLKKLESEKSLSREEIFCMGLRTCSGR